MTTGVLNEDGLIANNPSSIYLFSGGTIDPFDPKVEDVKIEDIAHSLANQARWSGHLSQRISVAEHCVAVSRLLDKREHTKLVCFTGLMHDASETYLVDLPRPLKKHPVFGKLYLELEAAIEAVIGEKFGIHHAPLEIPVVKWADDQVLAAEGTRYLAGIAPHLPKPEDDIPLYSWSEDQAEYEFLRAFSDLS